MNYSVFIGAINISNTSFERKATHFTILPKVFGIIKPNVPDECFYELNCIFSNKFWPPEHNHRVPKSLYTIIKPSLLPPEITHLLVYKCTFN
jgi:hypothetical protein